MTQTFYFVYKTTNLINNKIYIGKHKTKNLSDNYIGSGKLLKQAIAKYGRVNFTFEVLKWFETECDMNAHEAELVTEEFCLRNDNYNLCVGGKGGFSYINQNTTLNDRVKRLQTATIVMKTSRLTDPEKWSKSHQHQANTRKQRFRDGDYTKDGILERLRTGFKAKYGVHNASLVEEAVNKRKQTYSVIGHQQGVKNSQHGTIWITDGDRSTKISSVDPIPEGWYKGRKLK